MKSDLIGKNHVPSQSHEHVPTNISHDRNDLDALTIVTLPRDCLVTMSDRHVMSSTGRHGDGILARLCSFHPMF